MAKTAAHASNNLIAEVRAKFSEYAVLGYSGAGVIAARHATVTRPLTRVPAVLRS